MGTAESLKKDYAEAIKLYERNLQAECEAVILTGKQLHCIQCGKEMTSEYIENGYHHPICGSCRHNFGDVAAILDKSFQLALRGGEA